ncbi:hypothetical protein GVX81_10825 [[Haemophilus] felis]|uniref:CdiI C-terminal domain-containing protein n=1 Tax=[Haemophilus] felis TaxID=123822 RepID=A0A1T0B4X5_9PAST|nr:hypothetical protein [[Haemophilus] felis]NBI41803.1 hypothetical protein [[Haemophilus] felis]OOS05086.1 hypothetical protein B0188_04570 [[Haemophilus] felis]
MFNIKIEKNEFFNDWGDLIVKSKIIINDFSEYFDLPVSYWKVNDYKRSWVKSISQILNKNKDRAILFTSMYDLEKVNFLHSWIVYKKGNSAFIQNCILFRDDFNEFSLENIFKYIPDREIYSEYGEKISEWTTDFENIIRFYDKLKFELK